MKTPHDEPLRFAVLCIHLSPLPRALSLRKLVSESPNTASESGAQQDGLSSPVGAWTDSPPSHWFCLGPGSVPEVLTPVLGPSSVLFIYLFSSLPLGLPYVNWASQECCLFYLRSSPWSSDLPLFYFHGLFLSLSFSHRHFGLFFPILTT